ncbi:MAG: PAS domain S-box protein [Bacteroidetes bacterium]|jgi:PAS domain S-box-containing protein|nr:PAS domain S-box protein [Bacteroidota bacterium]
MEVFNNKSRAELIAELVRYRELYGISDQSAPSGTDETDKQSYLKILLDAIPDFIFVFDHQGIYLDCQTGRKDRLAMPVEQFIGRKVTDLFPAAFSRLIMNAINTVISSKSDKVIQYDLEIEEEKRNFEATFSRFGEEKIIAIVRDITDRKMIEQEFQNSQNKYYELLDLAPDLFFQGNEKGEILECNQKAVALTGFSRAELLHKPLARLFEPGELKHKPLRFDLLNDGDQIIQERTVITKSGDKLPVEMNSRRMHDGTYQTFMRDLTERRQNERKLQQAYDTFRGIFNTVSEAIYIQDAAGTFVEVNDGALKMYACTREELIGQSPLTVAAPGMNDLDEAQQLSAETLKTGVESRFEFWGKRCDGSIFPKDVSVNRGTFFGEQVLIATARDISAQKQAEKHIYESEKRYRQLFETIRQGVIYHDKDGLILQSNPAAHNILGLSQEQLTGKKLTRALCNWIREDGTYLADEDYAGYKALKHGKSRQDELIGILNPVDKQYRWILVNAYPEFENGKEKPFQVHVSFTDITALKTAEMKLEESEATYRNLFQNAQVGLFRTRIFDGQVLESNEQLAHMFGFENRAEFVKSYRTGGNYVDEGKREEMLEILNRTGSIKNYEVRFYKKDKSVFWVNYSARINTEKGWIEGVAEDITKRKTSELQLIDAKNKAEESDRLKSAFLANMSHEIRTPMNGILGFTQILQRREIGREDRQHYIDIIEKAGSRLLETVDNLIDIAKIETKQVPVKASTMDVEEKLVEHVNFFAPLADQKNLKIELNIQLSGPSEKIVTDIYKFDSVITNLIKNAIKYTSEGVIKVGCYVKQDMIVFFISDTGSGIPKSRHEAIFNRFEQADVNDRMALQGSGLGLAIAKAYIDMMKGKLWLESEEGKGSVFYFSLPLKQLQHEVAEHAVAIHEPNEVYEKRKMKVLIAEDDPSSSLYLETILKGIGAEVMVTRTGRETVEAVKLNPDISFVLMDIKMPDGSGLEATREIRKTKPRLPIIAQTAYALSGDEERAIEAGCNAYLTKPIRRPKLLELIKQIVG